MKDYVRRPKYKEFGPNYVTVSKRGFHHLATKPILHDLIGEDFHDDTDPLYFCSGLLGCMETNRCVFKAKDPYKQFLQCRMYVATRHHVVVENPTVEACKPGRRIKVPGINAKFTCRMVSTGYTNYKMRSILKDIASGCSHLCDWNTRQGCEAIGGCGRYEFRKKRLKPCRKVMIVSLYVVRRFDSHPWYARRKEIYEREREYHKIATGKRMPYAFT